MTYIRIDVDLDEIYDEMNDYDKRIMAQWLFDEGILSKHSNPEISELDTRETYSETPLTNFGMGITDYPMKMNY